MPEINPFLFLPAGNSALASSDMATSSGDEQSLGVFSAVLNNLLSDNIVTGENLAVNNIMPAVDGVIPNANKIPLIQIDDTTQLPLSPITETIKLPVTTQQLFSDVAINDMTKKMSLTDDNQQLINKVDTNANPDSSVLELLATTMATQPILNNTVPVKSTPDSAEIPAIPKPQVEKLLTSISAPNEVNDNIPDVVFKTDDNSVDDTLLNDVPVTQLPIEKNDSSVKTETIANNIPLKSIISNNNQDIDSQLNQMAEMLANSQINNDENNKSAENNVSETPQKPDSPILLADNTYVKKSIKTTNDKATDKVKIAKNNKIENAGQATVTQTKTNDTTPVKVAAFPDKENAFTPINVTNTINTAVATASVNSFDTTQMTDQQAINSNNTVNNIDVANDKTQIIPKMAAFAPHVVANNFPHAREALAMNIKQGIDEDITKIKIKMSPERLGTVDVTMNIASDGTVNAVIGADKIETFDWLRRDSSALQDMLQQHGLKMGQNGLSFAYNDGRQAFYEKMASVNKNNDETITEEPKQITMRSISSNQALDIHA